MKKSGQDSGFERHAGPIGPTRARCGLIVLLVALSSGPLLLAHSPVVDSSLSDWCVGAFTNTVPGGGRIEDTGVILSCGNCSVTTDLACVVASDCPTGENCVNPDSRTEIAWWDNRTDGAVNDLGTIVITQDNENLYFGAELWVDPDPNSLPFGEIAIDYAPGGVGTWHDPNNVLVTPGQCSVSTDRACTSDADCHFCAISTEPTGACSLTTSRSCAADQDCPGGESCEQRPRACGSGCDPDVPGDNCDVSQSCVGLGAGGLVQTMGFFSEPSGQADYLVLFDFSLWLISAGDGVMLMEPGGTTDQNAWTPVTGCEPDFVGDNTDCDFPPAVNPGQSGGSGGPPGSVEVAIPWSAFGCTGCPDDCSCPGFGPGQDFRFTMTVARGTLTLDFTPDGAHEDVLSEAVAQTTTTTTDSCAGFGIGNTACEIADASTDAFLPKIFLPHELVPGGAISGLMVGKDVGSIVLEWVESCSAADNDYGIYEGAAGDWASHLPIPGLCTTGGLTTATFTPGTGDHYYLVVPTDGNTEGSYGWDYTGAERPPSAAPCSPQSLGNCP
jgi:hypothetical protein